MMVKSTVAGIVVLLESAFVKDLKYYLASTLAQLAPHKHFVDCSISYHIRVEFTAVLLIWCYDMLCKDAILRLREAYPPFFNKH